MPILIIDQNLTLTAKILRSLRSRFSVEMAQPDEANALCQTTSYDAVIITQNTGWLCQLLRQHNILTPILIISPTNHLENKLFAFAQGADDYLSSPFEVPELIARLQALMRRPPLLFKSDILQIADLKLNLTTGETIRGTHHIYLRRKERQLLEYLLRNQGRILTRQMILDHLWTSDTFTYTNVVDVHIKYLRDKIDRPFSRPLLKTIHGFGYRLEG